MKRTVPLLVATLAVAACGQQSTTTTTTTTTNSATGEVSSSTSSTTGDASLSAKAMGLQPGKWETTISISDVRMNGVTSTPPPGVGAQKVTTCVTPEMAAKGPDQFLKQAGIECTTNVSLNNGQMSGHRSCKMPIGSMSSTVTGTYSPTVVVVDADATVTGRIEIREKVHTEARRIGDCD